MNGNHNRRNRFIIACLIALSIVIVFTSCSTPRRLVVSSPFSSVMPDRPELKAIDGESIPSVVVTNMVLLMDYAEGLEIYIEGLKEYYELT